MNDDIDNDPAAYLRFLQSMEREQELAKLRTLSLELAGVLDFFPKLREEVDAFYSAEGIAFEGLSDRLRPTLEKAADFHFKIGQLPADVHDAPPMQAFIQTVKGAMLLSQVQHFASELDSAQQSAIAWLEAKKAEEERRVEEEKRKADEEAKRLEQERLAAEQRARLEQERREHEAKVQSILAAIQAGSPEVVPEMVVIPAGQFTMGCVEEEWETEAGWFSSKRKLKQAARDDVEGGGYPNEKPAHPVSVARFSMGKYPVTFSQFDAYCEATGFAKPLGLGWGRGNRPVINVSWEDAQQYVRWLAGVTGQAYRLPSEAEWEYAARGGNDTTAYPWGQSVDPKYANYRGTVGKTTPVGQYPANGFGLYDMHGNVWEWCQDVWHRDYQGAPSTGGVWLGDDGTRRVLRGGSWNDFARDARSAVRRSCEQGFRGNGNAPDFSFSRIWSSWDNCIGFRLALGQ